MDINSLKLVKYPNEILKKISTDILDIDDKIVGIGKKMLTIMKENSGIGLAANQVGINLNIIVVSIPETQWIDKIIINPKLKSIDKINHTIKEGCLSLPGIYYEVERPKNIEITYFNEFGNKKIEMVDGLISSCLQHECDHLNGIMFPERLSKFKKERLFDKYKKINKN